MKYDHDLHEYATTLRGSVVTVYLDLTVPAYLERLDSVWFDGTNVTPILDPSTLTALSMEAEHALSGDVSVAGYTFGPSAIIKGA